jgi:hypothetical protein
MNQSSSDEDSSDMDDDDESYRMPHDLLKRSGIGYKKSASRSSTTKEIE